LQVVLTEQPEARQEILADLGANKKGRASIAPLSLTRNGHLIPLDTDTQPLGFRSSSPPHGAPLEAIKVVQSDSSVRPLLERLLGGTRVVRDLPAATAAWRENAGAFHFRYAHGRVLSRHGVYTGGYNNGNATAKRLLRSWAGKIRLQICDPHSRRCRKQSLN